MVQSSRYQTYPQTSSSSSNFSPVNHPMPIHTDRQHRHLYATSTSIPTLTQYLGTPKAEPKEEPKSTHVRVPSTGRYQPSRGAQRDAKYSKKEAAKAQSKTRIRHPVIRRDPSRPPDGQSFNGTAERYINLPLINRYVKPQQVNRDARTSELIEKEMRRAEQMATIEAARQAHSEMLRAEESKLEEQKKIKFIKLQVFVHARPTRCAWSGCEAILNSWATLEKHIHHCHLYPSHTPPGPVQCHWNDCGQMLIHRNACEEHVLKNHMGQFSARCPFNCLFEGDSLPALMAHIERRHLQATTDDFMPGLIHIKPQIPPFSELPPLPCLTHPFKYYPFNPIEPFSGGIGTRNRKMVQRSCFTGKYPRVHAYEHKKGAGAAISAIIENCKRLKTANEDFGARDGGEPAVKQLDLTTEKTIPLVDVVCSAKIATSEAKKELEYAGWSHISPSLDKVSESTSPIKSESGESSSPSIRSHTRSASFNSSSGDMSEFSSNNLTGIGETPRKSARLRLKVARSPSQGSQTGSQYSEQDWLFD
ncbi:uncharacterized protein I303_101205 [Kwoniella dejecticola CBS 10117]|uniref:C2H2-type domain-containing protein n=1 Tax=Kwoniella dejecticola CBS 10117 TaxID=1296121 RepID=A0A1A6AH41_9TREE|nr:uncharacterized protein I303_01211 [Kwoniella dejecticola CBS 10117]OBR89384.1 hypothetical protein I303_01211 [Kwoniella dejecticola CBS 10117]